MPYLTSDKKVFESVHFMGSLGEEKNDILLKAKVGVPNPTGRSETFCICAVEMQAMGCSVTAMEAPGYYDTIYNGIISHNRKQLEDNIVNLLINNSPMEYEDTLSYIKNNFSESQIAMEWEQLLASNLDDYLHPIYPIANKRYRYKWFKECLRMLKTICPYMYNSKISVEAVLNKISKNPDYKLTYHP